MMAISGDLTGDLAIEYIQDAHQLAKELNINRFLMDLTQSRNVDTHAENHNFAMYRIKNTPEVDTAVRVAALVRPGDKSHNFIEMVMQNSGMDMVLFRDRHEAIMHLARN